MRRFCVPCIWALRRHTRTGGRLNVSNIRNRLLPQVVERANARRERAGRMLLPGGVTPHTLRRTWAMLALTAGRDARWVTAQMGHTDARLTLQVYAQFMQRQHIDFDLVWQLIGFPTSPSGGPDWAHARRLTQRMTQ